MKKSILFLLLFIVVAVGSSKAQYLTPQWQLPLFFEDATGQRDTVWIGYDPRTSIYLDVIDPGFNEDWMWIDTTKFNAYFTEQYDGQPGIPESDSVRKREITSWTYMIGWQLEFTHGQMPITIKWNDSLLNSSKLSPTFYPDISPRPRARIDFMFWNPPIVLDENCNIAVDLYPDIILTNFVNANFPCHCIISDSLVLDKQDIYWDEMQDYFICAFNIAPHDFSYMDIDEDRDLGVIIYPNPTSEMLNIEKNNFQNSEVYLYNIQGNLLYYNIFSDNKILIDLSDYSQGIYILKIKTENKIDTFKINKI